MKISRAWGSHLPVLMKLVEKTDGDILEMGTGIFSTPYLHWICYLKDRHLISYENNPYYYKQVAGYQCNFHKIYYVTTYDEAAIKRPWDIAFIDVMPAERRRIDAVRVKNFAKYIILHDSQPGHDRYYKYSEIYSQFKYRYDFTEIMPNTTVVSNLKDVRNLF